VAKMAARHYELRLGWERTRRWTVVAAEGRAAYNTGSEVLVQGNNAAAVEILSGRAEIFDRVIFVGHGPRTDPTGGDVGFVASRRPTLLLLECVLTGHVVCRAPAEFAEYSLGNHNPLTLAECFLCSRLHPRERCLGVGRRSRPLLRCAGRFVAVFVGDDGCWRRCPPHFERTDFAWFVAF